MPSEYVIVGPRTVRGPEGRDHDVLEAIEELPWTPQLCPLMRHEYTIWKKGPEWAWNVLSAMLLARNQASFRAYFRGYQTANRYWDAPDGRRYWPVNLGRVQWIPTIRQAQYVQTALDRIELRVVVDRPLTDQEQLRVVELARSALDYPFNIDVKVIDEIGRGPTGKFEEFRSLVAESPPSDSPDALSSGPIPPD